MKDFDVYSVESEFECNKTCSIYFFDLIMGNHFTSYQLSQTINVALFWFKLCSHSLYKFWFLNIKFLFQFSSTIKFYSSSSNYKNFNFSVENQRIEEIQSFRKAHKFLGASVECYPRDSYNVWDLPRLHDLLKPEIAAAHGWLLMHWFDYLFFLRVKVFFPLGACSGRDDWLLSAVVISWVTFKWIDGSSFSGGALCECRQAGISGEEEMETLSEMGKVLPALITSS